MQVTYLLDSLKTVEFPCGRRGRPGMTETSMEEEDNEDEDEDEDMPSMFDRRQIMQWVRQNHRNRECQFRCGHALVATLIENGLDISDMDERERLVHQIKLLVTFTLSNVVQLVL